MSKIKALSILLSVHPEEAEELINYGDYLVYTDEEADEDVKEYIRESLWAFNPSFLSSYVDLEPKHITHIQQLYEDCNEVLLKLVGDSFDDLVEDAICSDGRGNFLATYDGKENEVQVEDVTYYIYRCN